MLQYTEIYFDLLPCLVVYMAQLVVVFRGTIVASMEEKGVRLKDAGPEGPFVQDSMHKRSDSVVDEAWEEQQLLPGSVTLSESRCRT